MYFCEKHHRNWYDWLSDGAQKISLHFKPQGWAGFMFRCYVLMWFVKIADAISWTKTDWKAQTFGYIIWALLSVTSILKNIVATWQACVWDLKMVHKQKTVMNKLRSQQNVFDDNRDQYETSGGVCWVIWDVNNVSEISNTPKIYFSPGARYSQFFCTKSFRVVIIRGFHITKWLHDASIKREKVANIDPAQTIFYRDYFLNMSFCLNMILWKVLEGIELFSNTF